MNVYQFLFIFLFSITACTAQETLDINTQIDQAVLALPETYRANATVMGYDRSTSLSIIKKGTNAMICLADDPNKNGFSVAGYHKDLDPYMARSRALKAEGKEFKESFDIKEQEVKEGKLFIPNNSMLYVVSGEYDEQGNPINLYQRFVVYIPFATTESSGLPLEPSYPGGPWIMNPGTHRAHIMINPTKVVEE
ncbi:MAG: hypothetical protein JXR07_04565 [Reichenbachiella sp.]